MPKQYAPGAPGRNPVVPEARTAYDSYMKTTLRIPALLGPAGPVTVSLTVALTMAFSLLTAPAVEAASPAGRPAIELVETAPIETSLDNPDLREAHEVWVEMIDGAQNALAFEQFYVSSEPGSRLEPVIAAVERAAARGVAIRFLVDKRFEKTYAETIARLDAFDGVTTRVLDTRTLMGGVQHSKYFVVDDNEIFVGSQNFDWRALEHIQELGVRVTSPQLAHEFLAIFEIDWAAAKPKEGEAPIAVMKREATTWTDLTLPIAGDSVVVRPAFSPKGHLRDESMWDLPQMVAMIDSAKTSVRAQMLTYKAKNRDEYWAVLDSALISAAARGVRVELLVSHWCERKGTIESLKELQEVPNIEVRILTPPEWSGGFIPYARVIHSKYMVVDGARSWVGTSNWERGYFYDSRNMGLVIEGAAIGGRLGRYFENGWTSEYTEPVDPAREYETPHIAD